MKLDYAAVRASDEIRTYITQADASLIAMGYTEHSFAHVAKCAETAAGLLSQLGYDERQVELATRDPLTGLLNHRSFQEAVAREIDACRTDGGCNLLAAMLDHFGIHGTESYLKHADARLVQHRHDALQIFHAGSAFQNHQPFLEKNFNRLVHAIILLSQAHSFAARSLFRRT